MQDQKIFMENEVELFKENGYWYVTDDEAGGYCEQYFNYEKALKDYEKRVKDKIEKRYTKASRVELPVIRQGGYRTILIDPPWDIRFIERKVRPNQKLTYNGTMTIEEITKLPVNELAADECDLFLWTTQTYLPYSFEILKAWGFKYHITLTWNKRNGLTQFGFHRRTEFCLYAYKNKLSVEKTGNAIPTHLDDEPDLIDEKSTIHSRKPEQLYRLIEKKCKPPRLELFARSKRNDWHVWGNQVESDISLDV